MMLQVTHTSHSSSQLRFQQRDSLAVADVEACVGRVKSSMLQAAILVQAGLQARFASLQVRVVDTCTAPGHLCLSCQDVPPVLLNSPCACAPVNSSSGFEPEIDVGSHI